MKSPLKKLKKKAKLKKQGSLIMASLNAPWLRGINL